MTILPASPDVEPRLVRPFSLDPRLPPVLKAELGTGRFQVLLYVREDLNTHVRILGKSCQLSNIRAYVLKVAIGDVVEVLEAPQVHDAVEVPPGTPIFRQTAALIDRKA